MNCPLKVKLKAFGAAREILGGKEIDWLLEGSTVSDLKHQLFTTYPNLARLTSLLIAVNQSYAEDKTTLQESDEIAIIPSIGRF